MTTEDIHARIAEEAAARQEAARIAEQVLKDNSEE